jgi:hypothetical protein
MVGVVMLNAVVPYLHRQSEIAKIPASETMDVLALAPWGLRQQIRFMSQCCPRSQGKCDSVTVSIIFNNDTLPKIRMSICFNQWQCYKKSSTLTASLK